MGIAALGSFAGGLQRGAVIGQDMAAQAEDMDYKREQRGVLREQQQRERANQAALDEANAAGAAVLKGYQDQWASQNMTLGGQPAQPFRATPQMMLEAGRARTDALLKKLGPSDAWAQSWSRDEAMRGSVRQQAAQRVQQALTTGADPGGAISEFFNTIDDGYQVSGVTVGKGADGKPIVQIDRKNRYSGEPEDKRIVVPVEQLVRDLTMMSANPADLAKHSMAMTLERFKLAGKLTEVGAKGEEDRKTEELKTDGRIKVEGVKGSEDRKTEGVKADLKTREPYTLADGAERVVNVPQPDGSLKATKIAGNKKDSTAGTTKAKELNQMAINNYGVLDAGTGRLVGNDATAKIAAATELLLQEDPSLGPNQAMERAARDLGLSKRK